MRAQLDQEKNITALVPRQPLEVHETVAECMIYANHWVARKIQEAFPHQALLRRHPPPRQEFFSQLVDSAEIRGFRMDTRWSTVALTHCCQSGSMGTGDLCTPGGAEGHIDAATYADFVAGETCGTCTGGGGE